MNIEGKRFIHNPDFIFRKIVDEVVLVPIHNNIADMDCIYSLNAVGAYIWEQLAQPASQQELEAAILSEFDCDQETASKDLDIFLQEMLSYGALQEV